MNKYYQKLLAQKVGPIISASGLTALAKPIYGGLGHIIMLHRVLPDLGKERIHNHLSLEITNEHLESTIKFFKKRKYAFLSLNEIVEGLSTKTLKKPFVHYTLDDGYVDNFTNALPIFKKHNVPFTVYITTSFPDNKAILWWYMLENLVLKNNEISFNKAEQQYEFKCDSETQKEVVFNQIRRMIIQSFERGDFEFVNQLFSNYGINASDYIKNMAMSWEQIKQLSIEPLACIGAHTVSHKALSKLSKADALNEITESARILEKHTGKKTEHFSYPFGKSTEAGKREFELVKNAGFKSATTTRQGNITSAHSSYLSALPRITINSITNKHLLNLQTSGILPAVAGKFKRTIVH